MTECTLKHYTQCMCICTDIKAYTTNNIYIFTHTFTHKPAGILYAHTHKIITGTFKIKINYYTVNPCQTTGKSTKMHL